MKNKKFTSYLEGKNLAPSTVRRYEKHTELFFGKMKKEAIQVTKPDILKYLEHLKNRGLQNKSRHHHLVALNHYFAFLYENEQIDVNPCLFLKIHGTKQKRLHKIYTSEELETLFDNYYQIFVRNFDGSHIPANWREQAELCKERNALMLSLVIYQRATAGETAKIELGDIDFFKATIKLRGGRRSNDRTLPLSATQTGLLMNYLQNTRPKIFERGKAESDRLFFAPSVSSVDTAFDAIEKQIKTIDRQFLHFKQLRASTLCFWIKAHGLRKAQYLAGHRYVSSTEGYLHNNLDELIEDINKMHPF